MIQQWASDPVLVSERERKSAGRFLRGISVGSLAKSRSSCSIGRGWATTLHNARGRQNTGFYVDRAPWDCTRDTAQPESKAKGAPLELGSLAVRGERVSLKLASPDISNPRFTC